MIILQEISNLAKQQLNNHDYEAFNNELYYGDYLKCRSMLIIFSENNIINDMKSFTRLEDLVINLIIEKEDEDDIRNITK